MNYYNEIDPHAAAWLRELIKANLISEGVVDERSILEVQPADLKGFQQCHFFAGIGVWSYALRQADWADDRPVWTGSCPCQPFSSAGTQKGIADERHLWPAFYRLIEECRPAVVLGEQVSNALAIGKAGGTHAGENREAWIDHVFSDLERSHYATGAISAPAAGVGSPHIRQRLWWMGISQQSRLEGYDGSENRVGESRWVKENSAGSIATSSIPDGLGNTNSATGERDTGAVSGKERKTGSERKSDGNDGDRHTDAGQVIGLADTYGMQSKQSTRERSGSDQAQRRGSFDQYSGCSDFSGLGDTDRDRLQAGVKTTSTDRHGDPADSNGEFSRSADAINGHWRDADWLFCRDGKWRAVESGTAPLVNGPAERMVRGSNQGAPINADKTTEARVMRLKGYGNAINSESARVFIECVKELI